MGLSLSSARSSSRRGMPGAEAFPSPRSLEGRPRQETVIMAKEAINEALIQSLEPIQDPQALIGELFRRFGDRAAIGTSGQLTGVVMIDLAVKAGLKPRVFTIDTLRLFPETYELFDALEQKYSLKVEKIQPDPERLKAMLSEHGEFLFFDSKEKQEFCCH
ncbi:phosphoadenosine phosphosulfate reductase family protein, partial [bacterium]